MQEKIPGIAKRCVDDIADTGKTDLSVEFSSRVPVRTLAEVWRIPDHLRAGTGAAASYRGRRRHRHHPVGPPS